MSAYRYPFVAFLLATLLKDSAALANMIGVIVLIGFVLFKGKVR